MNRRWWTRSVRSSAPARRTGARLGLESLEAREVPAVSLVSVASNGTAPGSAISTASNMGSVSDDGRYVVFLSAATNLVPGQTDTNGFNDVFLRDTQTNTTRLLTRQAGTTTTAGNGRAYAATISADGNWVALTSDATNLTSGISYGTSPAHVFLYSVAGDALQLVTLQAGSTTVAADARQGDTNTAAPSLSADGRYLTFVSGALDLITGQNTTGDPNGFSLSFPVGDAFLYDRLAAPGQRLSLVSHIPGNLLTGANDPTSQATVSRDGSKVVFTSYARNLGQTESGSFSSSPDHFLYDRATGSVTLITRDASNATLSAASQSDQDFLPASISANGRYVAYASRSSTLVSGVTGFSTLTYNLYLYDAQTGTNTLLTRVGNTAVGGAFSLAGERPVVSADGAYVAFTSSGANLVSGVAGGSPNVYLYTVAGGSISLVSRGASATTAVTGRTPTISSDGRYVAYVSTTAAPDTYLFDRTTGTVTLVSPSTASATTPSGGVSTIPTVSGDGSTVVWNSTATNLVAGDTNGAQDVFLNRPAQTPQAPTTTISQTTAPRLSSTPFAQFITTPGGTYTYQFINVPTGPGGQPLFSIQPNPNQPGQFFLVTGPTFGQSTQTTFSVTIQTTNTQNQQTTQTTFTITPFTIQTTFTPIGQPGVTQTLAPGRPNLPFAIAQPVITGTANQTFQVTLAPGQGNNNLFTIDPSGQLSTTPAFVTAPAQPTYSIVISTTDPNFPALTYTTPFTVTRVPDPTDISLGNTQFPPQSSSAVGTLTVPGSSRNYTYALVSGPGDTNNALFTVVGSVLRTVASFPTTVPATYTVRIRVTDPDFPALTFEEPFTVTAVDAPIAPTLTVPTVTPAGDEGSPIKLNIGSSTTSPGAVVTVVVSGVPTNARFVNGAGVPVGTNNGNGSWTFTQAQLADLFIVPPDNGTLNLGVAATAAFPGNPNTRTTVGTFAVAVANVAPAVTVTTQPTFDPTIPAVVVVSVTDPGDDVVQSVVVNWGDGTVQTFAAAGRYEHPYALAQQAYTITVTVADDDGTAPAVATPVTAKLADPQQAIVADLYTDILGRPADAAGLAGFAGQMAAGASVAQIATALVNSNEYRTKAVNDLYADILGRPADPTGLSNALALINFIGLDPALTQLRASILGSDEFFAKSGGTADGFLRSLYLTVLDRPIDPTGLAGFTAALNGGLSRAAVAQAILSSAEAKQELVEEAYRDLLGREGDAGGIQGFTALAAVSETNVILAMVTSDEFRRNALS